jgi:hypothetical protein
MKQFSFSVMVQISVEAPDVNDAREVIDDYLGNSEFGALEVVGHEILDEEELG